MPHTFYIGLRATPVFMATANAQPVPRMFLLLLFQLHGLRTGDRGGVPGDQEGLLPVPVRGWPFLPQVCIPLHSIKLKRAAAVGFLSVVL